MAPIKAKVQLWQTPSLLAMRTRLQAVLVQRTRSLSTVSDHDRHPPRQVIRIVSQSFNGRAKTFSLLCGLWWLHNPPVAAHGYPCSLILSSSTTPATPAKATRKLLDPYCPNHMFQSISTPCQSHYRRLHGRCNLSSAWLSVRAAS